MSSLTLDVKELQKHLRNDEMNIESLLRKLKNLREVNIPFPRFGICTNASCHYVSSYLSQFWPLFSGDSNYPIPHPNMEPEDAFNEFYDLWGDRAFLHLRDPDDHYRRNRWDYLDWLIDQLEELLPAIKATNAPKEI